MKEVRKKLILFVHNTPLILLHDVLQSATISGSFTRHPLSFEVDIEVLQGLITPKSKQDGTATLTVRLGRDKKFFEGTTCCLSPAEGFEPIPYFATKKEERLHKKVERLQSKEDELSQQISKLKKDISALEEEKERLEQIVNQEQIIEKLKNGVVNIKVTKYDGSPEEGTGFIVQREEDIVYILTASHVVEGSKSRQVDFYPGGRKLFPAEPLHGAIERNDPEGLAIIVVEGNGENGEMHPDLLALTFSATPPKTEKATAIGFPNDGPPWHVVKGNTTGREMNILYFSEELEGGHSGGPLVNKAGEVIGVLVTTERGEAHAVFLNSMFKARLNNYKLNG